MNNAFKIKKLTPEEIQEITNYIQNLVDNKSFEEVEALAKTDGNHCRYVMEFFSLPKTNLHKEFREKFCNMEKQVAAKYLEGRIIGEMKQNKELFIKEHLIDSYEYNNVKYQIVDRYFISSGDTEDEVIQISIPYFSSQAARDKFGYGITIYRSKCPDFFDRLVRDMRVYKGNADLTSNRK